MKPPSEMSDNELIKAAMRTMSEGDYIYLSELRGRLGQRYEQGYCAGLDEASGEDNEQ